LQELSQVFCGLGQPKRGWGDLAGFSFGRCNIAFLFLSMLCFGCLGFSMVLFFSSLLGLQLLFYLPVWMS